ncbi:MAG TPA: PAC2 family protein [Acidimicrobiia bacterium]|nr:PAC2 family protein [Acidimicrobiia bacterium]
MSTFEWLTRPTLQDPLAVLAFSGWGDAGDSSSEAARFLVEEFETQTIGRFDSDSFFDFQVNRPVVSLDEAGVRSISWPTTEVLSIESSPRDLVVVIGAEPNYNWKKFVSELCSVLRQLGVKQAISLGAFVGQVAHTSPVPVVGSSSSTRLIAEHGLMPSRYEGPTGIVGVLTQGLAQCDIDTMSLWAAVPYYLSNQSYPPGAEALVRKLTEVAQLSVNMRSLELNTAQFQRQVDEALDESDELADYVRELEAEGIDPEHSGEELVDEIERYLRGL